MGVPATINDLSTVAGSNYPVGTESPTTIDDYFRAHASFIAGLRDGKVNNTGNETIAGVKTFSSTIVGSVSGSAGSATTATSATSATTATNIAGGAAGAVPYQSGAGATALLAAGTSGQILKSNGAAAPAWVDQSTLSVGSATNATNATNASAVTNGVYTVGNQTIGGVKTFSSSPSVPNGAAAGDAVNKGQIDAAIALAMPTGAVMAFYMSSAPSGWLECNGQSTAGYPALAALIGANVPDLRGEFVRGWDHGKGTDPSRSIGSLQADEIKQTTGSFGNVIADLGGGGSGALSVGSTGGRYAVTPDGGGGQQYKSINLSIGSGSETRPRNVALMYCIKT
ncbi:MAG: tail fiber protein [Acidobacteriota bacterium]